MMEQEIEKDDKRLLLSCCMPYLEGVSQCRLMVVHRRLSGPDRPPHVGLCRNEDEYQKLKLKYELITSLKTIGP